LKKKIIHTDLWFESKTFYVTSYSAEGNLESQQEIKICNI